MFDTHAHLNFKDFEKDYAEVIRRSFDNGLKGMINVGSDFKMSKRAVKIASEYEDGIYAAVGLHPIYINQEKFDTEAYKELAKNEKVVAIGETGLDYFRSLSDPVLFPKSKGSSQGSDEGSRGLQKKVFIEHLRLAQELNLPLILHCRGEKNNPLEAYRDMIEILQHYYITEYSSGSRNRNCKNNQGCLRGVIHCFQADLEIAQEFIRLGFYVGFTGIITFSKDQRLLGVVKKIPLDKILLETDCPFLAPAPYRGERSEPWQVKFIAEKIAEIKKISFEKVIKETTKNAIDLIRKTRVEFACGKTHVSKMYSSDTNP